jgi:DnaJ-class molecular chaperone
MTLYEILGVQKDAPPEEIKAAFRRLAKSNHPDHVDEARRAESTQRMALINRAHDVLSDPERRAQYDRTGEMPGESNSIEKQAEEALAVLFSKYLDEEGDFIHGDICARLTEFAIKVHSTQQSNVGKLKQKLTALERKLKRIARKSEGKDLFKMVAEEKLSNGMKTLAKAEDEVKISALLIELLKEYKDTSPGKPTIHMPTLGITSATMGGKWE